MEERIHHFDTFLWAAETHQVDPDQLWDHKDTRTEVRITQKNTLAQVKSGALPCSAGGNALQLRTFIGAIVSGTWPYPDPFWITKLLEVGQSHMRAHPHGDGKPPRCYSGAYLCPCCSQDHLNHMTSKTNRSGNVVSPPCLCAHTHTHTHSHLSILESRLLFRSSPAEVWMRRATKRWDQADYVALGSQLCSFSLIVTTW